MTGFEPLIAGVAVAAANKLAELVIETGWGGSGGILDRFRTVVDGRTRSLIFNASQQYIKNYHDRHCLLKVLGMREPVSLESVYTAVRLLDGGDIAQFGSIAALEETYRQRGNRRFQQKADTKQKGVTVANAEPFLMVLGQPGAGKSTFLRKMGLEALKGKQREFQHRCIPVFIELKRFVDSNINLEHFIISEFETCGFPNAKGVARKALEKGKLLILLDGLDEVPIDNLNAVIVSIQDFVDRYAKNRYIASCRIAAYGSSFRRFTDVTMAEFDDVQIQQFIKNWFQSEEDKTANIAVTCWETLQHPDHSGAKELAHRPLLLTFLCLVYDRSQEFPNNRSVLYRKALRILLEEWAAEKRLQKRRQIYEGLNIELEEFLLSKLACDGFVTNRLFLTQREIVKQIKSLLAKNLNAPQHLDGKAVLDAITIHQGILMKRAEDVYSFSHLTLQEYLTAYYIDDQGLIKPLVQKYLTDRRWRDVFLLVAGIMHGGADELLRLMEKQTQTYLSSAKIRSLLQWADAAIANSDGIYKPAAKRVIALDLVRALDRNRSRSLARVLARDRALDRTRALDLALALDPHHGLDRTRALTFALALDRARARTFDRAHARTLDRAHYQRARILVSALDRARALALDCALDCARTLKELKIFQSVNLASLITQLESLKSQIRDGNQSDEIHQTLADRIRQLWFNVLHLNPDLVKLSEEETNALNNYLYSCELMVRCKESAMRVSPQVWAGVEDRMLRVIDEQRKI